MKTKRNLGRYGALSLAATTLACSSPDSLEQLGAARAASTLQTGEVDGKLISYRQRLPLSSIGSAPVQLHDGRLLDAARAAESSLKRHRKLKQELAAARSALQTPATTTEELIETERTVMLVATTNLLVVDPVALRNSSPMFRKFHMKGPGGMPLAGLRPEQRAAFADFKAEMLQKSRTHPLGAAARQGDAALWAAATSGLGDFQIVTKVEVPIGGLNSEAGTYQAPALTNGSFDYTSLHALDVPGFRSQLPTFQDEHTLGIDSLLESGSATTRTAFVNGFTIADSYDWDETWRFGIGHVTVEAGASYGVGLRAPIQVTGVITPTDISHVGGEQDVESEFQSSLSVDVFDADREFYEEAGIDSEDLFDGHELVLNAEAHVSVEVELLKWIDVNVTLPKGFSANFDQDFDPPFADCDTDCGLYVWLPASLTRTQINVGIAGANAQVGFNIAGEGEVELDYETTYDHQAVQSASGAGDGMKLHRLRFDDRDARSFHTTLAPLEEHGHKLFGYEVSDLDYNWDVQVTPGVKGRIWVDCWLLDWDEDIGPFWLDFAEVDLGRITLGTHAGSRASQAVNKGQKTWSQVEVGQNPEIDIWASPDDVFTPPPDDDGVAPHDGGNLPSQDAPSHEAIPQGQVPSNLPELEQPSGRDPLDQIDP